MATESKVRERYEQTLEVRRRCQVSMEKRRATCDALRMVYERGSVEVAASRWNRIRSHLDRVGSYLYMPGTERFGVHIPAAVREMWAPAGEVVRDEFRAKWTESGATLAFN